jgi:hypothetical protein
MAKTANDIVKTSRCILPGGRFVVMGYDANDKEVFGLGTHPKNFLQWARSGGPGDLRRVRKAFSEWLKETQS